MNVVLLIVAIVTEVTAIVVLRFDRPLSFLLSGHAGGWLLVVGLTLACGGLLWSDRITDRLAS